MTPAEHRQHALDRIFQLGWDAAADAPPLTDEQIERCAFIIAPHLAAPSDPASTALPQAA